MLFFSCPFLAASYASFVSFNRAIFIFFAPLAFALLAATHVFPIPLSSWEQIPLWVVCRSTGPVLVPDFLFFILLPGCVLHLTVLRRDLVLELHIQPMDASQ